MTNLFLSHKKYQLQESVSRREQDSGIDVPASCSLLTGLKETVALTTCLQSTAAALVASSQVPKAMPQNKISWGLLKPSVPRQKLQVSPAGLPPHKAGKAPDRYIGLGEGIQWFVNFFEAWKPKAYQ